MDAAFLGWAGAWLDPGFPAVFDLSAELARIQVPMLILQGRDDPYGTVAHARLAERLAPADVRTVMLAARHAPHLEAGEETTAEIVRFVGKVASSTVARPSRNN